MTPITPEESREFVRLFTVHSRRIYSFVRALVPNQADAEELFQETSSTMWEKFSDFTPGTDFRAWGFQIAHFKVLNYRQKHSNAAVVFNDQLVEKLESESLATADGMDDRSRALADCYQKLPERDRTLIDARYEQGATVPDVARRVDRSVDYVYKALRRIHIVLHRCIDSTVSGES